MTARGLFVVGTDTGVGKTRVAAGLLTAYGRLGHRCVGMKPVAAGAELQNGAWVNEDVERLKAASTLTAAEDLVNPYLFREAIAPHIAADHKGAVMEVPRMRAAYEALARMADVVVVEGAGGLLVPLSATQDMADVALALGLPVILVVGMRLGCLNHALLTREALAHRGLDLAGWVANRLDGSMAAYGENLATLEGRLGVPLLADLPFAPEASAERVADRFSPKRLNRLLFT
ncbi:MAG: dethiobiotin synthase [Hydrogenophilaceae bacterium]|nr:dethiobiotin synthase [Hydrogenophilaceae bacterium]